MRTIREEKYIKMWGDERGKEIRKFCVSLKKYFLFWGRRHRGTSHKSLFNLSFYGSFSTSKTTRKMRSCSFAALSRSYFYSLNFFYLFDCFPFLSSIFFGKKPPKYNPTFCTSLLSPSLLSLGLSCTTRMLTPHQMPFLAIRNILSGLLMLPASFSSSVAILNWKD